MDAWKLWLSLLIIIGLQATGCAPRWGKPSVSQQDCLEALAHRLQHSPTLDYLATLDRQHVDLKEFFQLCRAHMPVCSLPQKFYHWKHEVKIVRSKTEKGSVVHKVRIYFNYLSTCDPASMDARKTHGDIAEFYDADGEFMGLAVYAGDGFYFPLPYSKYSGERLQLRMYMKDMVDATDATRLEPYGRAACSANLPVRSPQPLLINSRTRR